jgi:hypothetical protein
MSHKAQTKPQKNTPLIPTPGAVQRLAQAERDIKRLNASINDVAQILAANKPILDAVVEMLGTQNVVNMIREQHVRNLRAQNENRVAAMQKLIDTAAFVKIDVVDADSIILTEEADAQGEVLEPGRTFDHIPAFAPEVGAKLIGMRAGERIETQDGNVLTVLEVYGFNTNASQDATPVQASATPEGDSSAGQEG